MFDLKRNIMAFVLVLVPVTFFALMQFNRYVADIGFATKEGIEEFQRNRPTCHGYSMTLSDDTPADGSKIDLCLGWLERK